MSIITDALNRLQAERARSPGQPQASATPEPAETADVRTFRIRPSSMLVVLGGVGIAAYLWGLPLIAAPDKGPPEHETGTVKAVNPVKHGPSQIVEAIPEQGEEPFIMAVTEEREDARPMEAASATGEVAPATGPDSSTNTTFPVVKDVKDTLARNPRSSPGVPATTATTEPPPTRRADSSSQRKKRGSSWRRNATPFQANLVRAQSFIKQRRYARAVTVLQPLLVHPRWEPWFWLGTAQLGLGQWEKARASLVEGLARDATVPHLWVQRALVSQQQGRFGEALDALRQAELLDPNLPAVHLNLAYSLEATGDRLMAVKHYRMFLALTEGKKSYHATRKKVLDRISRLSKT